MDQWEIPSCSICYERLLTDLSLLPNCGHIYHNNCLNSWHKKINSVNLSCPLCRKNVDYKNVISLKYSISRSNDLEHSDSTLDSDKSPSPTDENPKSEHESYYRNEIDDLRSRLSKSADDNLNLLREIQTIENEKREIEERLSRETRHKEVVIRENRDLKLSHENDMTTISGLNSRVKSLKYELEKLSHLSKYFDTREFETSEISPLLSNMNNEDKVKFLKNRIVDLDRIVSDLKETISSITQERNRMDRYYKNKIIEMTEALGLDKLPPIKATPQLPGIENDDFINDTHEKRRKIDRILNRTMDANVSTPDRLKMTILKAVLTPETKTRPSRVLSSPDPLNTPKTQTELAPPSLNGHTQERRQPTSTITITPTRLTIGKVTGLDKTTHNASPGLTSPSLKGKLKRGRRGLDTEPAQERAFTIHAFFKEKK